MMTDRPIEKLMSRSNRTPSGCIEWTGYKNPAGYGQVRVNSKSHLVHRLAWVSSGKALPDGMLVCHKCDNPACFNTEHLFVGTHKDNMQDMKAKGRSADKAGEKCGKAKLSTNEVDEIRRLVAGGKTQASVALKFDIHPSHISRIVNKKRWPR